VLGSLSCPAEVKLTDLLGNNDVIAMFEQNLLSFICELLNQRHQQLVRLQPTLSVALREEIDTGREIRSSVNGRCYEEKVKRREE